MHCLVHHHVPKTYGTLISRWVKGAFLFYGANLPPLPMNRPLYMGHWTIALSRPAIQNCAHMTIMRDPVERVLSALKFHGKPVTQWESCIRGDASCRGSFEYNNDLTRMFSARRTENHYDESTMSRRLSILR